jgi:hypothetical protein
VSEGRIATFRDQEVSLAVETVTPVGHDGGMRNEMENLHRQRARAGARSGGFAGSSLLGFAEAADGVCRVAHQLALTVPSFRSPPASADVDRSIRWASDGCATVAVRVRGRPATAVERDLVEGVLQANRLSGVAREEARQKILALLGTNQPQTVEPAA